ncbi:MAG: 2-dehydropantoate 2-reductase [Chloroflexota bacterium]
MKILVYGAGAIGGYFGGRLSQSGHNVTFIVREVNAEAIDSFGLTIVEKGLETTARPKTASSIPQAFNNNQEYDLIILGMKSYDLFPSLDPLIAFCPNPKKILTTQNGIGIENKLVEQFGAESVIAGSVTLPISKETSNRIKVEREGGIALAPTSPKQQIKAWAQLFQKAQIPTTRFKDFESMKWSKAMLNIVGNASSAILNRSPKAVYSSEIMYDLEIRMLKEMLKVMEAKKLSVVDLPGYSAKNLAFGVRRMPRGLLKPILSNVVSNGRGDKMPSFHIDLNNRKGKSEVIYHNAAIAQVGKQLNIATPVNAALASVLIKIIRQEVDWREFNGRPKRLLAEVKKFEATL